MYASSYISNIVESLLSSLLLDLWKFLFLNISFDFLRNDQYSDVDSICWIPSKIYIINNNHLIKIYLQNKVQHTYFFSMKVNHSEMCSYLRDKLRWMVQIHVSKRGMFNKRNVSLFVMLRFKTRNDEMDAINYSICMMVNRSK